MSRILQILAVLLAALTAIGAGLVLAGSLVFTVYVFVVLMAWMSLGALTELASAK